MDSTTVDADHYRKRGLDWLKLVSIWLDITRLVIVLEFESLGEIYIYTSNGSPPTGLTRKQRPANVDLIPCYTAARSPDVSYIPIRQSVSSWTKVGRRRD